MEKVIEIKLLPENRFEVIITLPDFLGLLSVITGLFSSYGLSIVRGRIGTVEGKAHDIFEVQSRVPPDWTGFEKDLVTLTEQWRKGEAAWVRKEINRRIIYFLRTHREEYCEQLLPISLDIDQYTSPNQTIIDIHAQDTPAFLYELTNALSMLGINIVRMEIDTVEGRVQDRLWVTTDDGHKILDEEKLKALQWAVLLVKQFTHLLPKVPDPLAALEQVTLFGKDIFSRNDFTEVLLSLKKSHTLQDLSKVFGTSRFLWEEFIRTQHESIFPILTDERFLKLKKDRQRMQHELEELIQSKKTEEERIEVLNEYKDREMFRIDLRHILGKVSYLVEFAEEFTDLAEAVVEVAYRLAWESVLKKYAAPVIGPGQPSECTILALGKFGGRELGYASDLEVMFVYTDDEDSTSLQSQANLQFYSELVRQFRRIIHARGEGVFEIDLRLRPYGKDGPLAVSLELFRKYYQPGGGAWGFERQALIKLRPITGPDPLREEIEKIRNAFVYGDHPFDFKEALALRERQRHELVTEGSVNAKYSAGGLLDVEYLVQTLQIVYGRRLAGDVRSPNTLRALRGLWEAGAIPVKKFQMLRASYIFLRSVINALRIVRGNAKDLTIPSVGTEQFTILGRRVGYTGDDATVQQKFSNMISKYMTIAHTLYQSTLEELALKPWGKTAEEVFVISRMPAVNLDNLLRGDPSPNDKKALALLGFRDITDAVSRFQRICPNMLTFEPFAVVIDRSWSLWPGVPDPQMAVAHWQYLIEALGERQEEFWESLVESEEALEILLTLLGTSRYLSNLLVSRPENWKWLQKKENLDVAHTAALINQRWDNSFEPQGLRLFRHQETLRLAMAEIYAGQPLDRVFGTFSRLADFVLNQVLRYIGFEDQTAIMALGKLGGEELNFSSDVDLMFLAADSVDSSELIRGLERMLNLLKEGGPEEFLYRVDLRLRPHGEHGSLAMKAAQYGTYYENEAEPWEHQILIKARPVAGNRMLAQPFLKTAASLLYERPWSEEAFERLREVKRRYEAMTSSKGESESNIKLGRGGIRDIEFTLQMLQLRHGGCRRELRQPNTFEVLTAVEKIGLLTPEECTALGDAYCFLRRIENRLQLFENRQVFNLPTAMTQQKWLAVSMGYRDKENIPAEEAFHKDLSRLRSRCREIFERVFFGLKPV